LKEVGGHSRGGTPAHKKKKVRNGGDRNGGHEQTPGQGPYRQGKEVRGTLENLEKGKKKMEGGVD